MERLTEEELTEMEQWRKGTNDWELPPEDFERLVAMARELNAHQCPTAEDFALCSCDESAAKRGGVHQTFCPLARER